MVSSEAFARRNQGMTAVILSTLLIALTISELISQYYRKIPATYTEGLVNSDSLVFPDLVMQISSGQAGLGDWISNPAPFWLTDFMTTWIFMTLTGNDWLLTLALYSVLMCLLVTWGLATVVRLASGSSWTRSWLVSAALVAASVLFIRFDGGLPARFLFGNRPFNVAAFFFACAGLAKVVASGRPTHHLSWVYCVSCLAFGASDALLMFHVALPVLFASLYWLRVVGLTREACGYVAVSATGVVLVLAGYLLNMSLSPFEPNITGNSASQHLLEVLVGISSAFEHAILDGLASFGGGVFVLWLERMSDAMLRSISFSLLLFMSVLFLSAWAIKAQVRKNAKQKPHDQQACAKALLLAMAWSLILCGSSVFLLFPEWKYFWPMMWVLFLSLAVAIACREQGLSRSRKQIEGLAVVAIAVVLAIDLSFFRPSEVVSMRLECTRIVLNGTGLERGISHYWHAREVKVTGGYDKLDIVLSSTPVPGRPTVFKTYPHVGNVGHNKGKADYVVAEDKEGDELSAFKEGLGLPSRIATCDDEIYLLYEKETLRARNVVILAAKTA